MLTARSLSFAYSGGQDLFNGISFTVRPGEVLALTGASGRGKSTLLYILGLMLLPDSGDVIVRGESTSAMSDASRSRARARQFGFLFQDAALDPSRSVLDNIVEGALYRNERRSQVYGDALRLMREFDVLLDPRSKPGHISGGQAQRIALCRALLGSPRLLIADEPTGSLDRASASLVIDALVRRARSGAAAIIATHDPMVVGACDRTISL